MLIPPIGDAVRSPARFDVVVLVRTAALDDLDAVRAAAPVDQMRRVLHAAATRVHELAARCGRLLGPVDHNGRDLFLFNHFAAADGGRDLSAATILWEHLAGWYAAETGLQNSILLEPVADDDYLFVNHASWRTGPVRLGYAQFRRKSFHSYVRANLAANRLIAMPVLYRLVTSPAAAEGRSLSRR